MTTDDEHTTRTETDDVNEQEARRARLGEALARGEIPHNKLYGAIRDLGKGHVEAAVPAIARYLTDPDAEVRNAALLTLVFDFGLPEYWETAYDFLAHDPYPDNRMLGASALGSLQRGTRDLRTLAALAPVVRNEREEAGVREAAYLAMRRILGADAREQLRLTVHGDFPRWWIGHSSILTFWPMIQRHSQRKPDMPYIFKSDYTLDDLRRGVVPPGALYSTLHDLGRERVEEGVPDIERFLTHDDPQLRYVALEVLAFHFQLPQHAETARRFLVQDPDDDCRRLGAAALGKLRRDTQDETTARLLAPVVRNLAENLTVRETAYLAMREIMRFVPRERFFLFGGGRADIDHEPTVDWAFVDSFLTPGDRG